MMPHPVIADVQPAALCPFVPSSCSAVFQDVPARIVLLVLAIALPPRALLWQRRRMIDASGVL
jgi:hypothetical protein